MAIDLGSTVKDLIDEVNSKAPKSDIPSTSDCAKLSGNNTFTGSNTFNKTISGSISGNAATATKATQDSNGNNIADTYVKKSGSTMGSLNALKADLSTTQNIIPDITAVASTPFARCLWHDHFAFLSTHTIIDNQVTTDGSTWTDDTLDLTGLFIQKEMTPLTILTSSQLSRRFVIYSPNNFIYSMIRWYEIGVSYSNTFSNFEVHIESSSDNSTWSDVHKSTISSYMTSTFLYGKDFGNAIYLRFTFTKVTNKITGIVNISYLKGYTKRKADQGLGIEREYPYSWNSNRDIYPYGDNVRSLGLSSNRWANVYAKTFNGDLSGTATKATQDGNGNVITSTYAAKSHKHSVTAEGTNSSTSITPAGTVSQPTFTGTAASHNHTFTGTAASHNHTFSGTAESHSHTFTGTEATIKSTYTPSGSVTSGFTGTAHNHTFTGSSVTSGKPDTTNVTTIYSMTGVGSLPSASLSSGTLPSCSYTAPSLTASVENQCLTLSFNAGSHSFSAGSFPTLTFSAGSLPTRSSAISMPNANHTHSVKASGTIGDATAGGTVSSSFSGTEGEATATYTPAGTISSTSVTPAGTISDKSITPAGTISNKELTPAGTVSKPTFTGTAASHTHTFTGSAVNSATES